MERDLTTAEKMVLDSLPLVIHEVRTKSDREFDLSFDWSGEALGPGLMVNGSSWLPLHIIHNANWTEDPIAGMAEYPKMAFDGDWSGIRDSGEDIHWEMFELLQRS